MKLKTFWNPAVVSLLFIIALIALVILNAKGDVLELAQLGTQYSEGDPNGSEGYDGQFFYYMALESDPSLVAGKLDVPPYRYQRILLPLIARFFSFGVAELIPWTFLLISMGIHFFATKKLSEMMAEWGVNPFFALGYGLWVGIVLAIRLNLPEALAIGLFVIAVGQLHKKKDYSAWLLLGLAVFAKETMLIFAFGIGLVYLAHQKWRKLLGLFLFAILPFAIFQLWIFRQFGEFGIGSGGIRATSFEIIPFNGIWKIADFGLPVLAVFLLVYVPIVIIPVIAGIWVAVRKSIRGGEPELEPILLFVTSSTFLFLPFSLYSEPIGLLRMLSVLFLSWLLFAAKYRMKGPLIYALFGISLNAVLISEILAL